MYVYFSMMLMILTDEFEKQKNNPISFKEIGKVVTKRTQIQTNKRIEKRVKNKKA